MLAFIAIYGRVIWPFRAYVLQIPPRIKGWLGPGTTQGCMHSYKGQLSTFSLEGGGVVGSHCNWGDWTTVTSTKYENTVREFFA